ncbi:hypothetical protein OV203_21590 [Nannocystis sp. ILAH1]|uniref:hypothetical protein n=1 Tax=Nannocystis sp. ILAH1 TaxID=2996789 RepID=UPI00226FA01C|nr:hypothetical protein [Nannocystis sp. ILAH1]MCY0989745.1 hypothetical protein [Nannocystis sp. ILAH1]
MEDAKTPMAAAEEQPWVRIMTGLLQFVGGGLVALHEQDGIAPKKWTLCLCR